MGDREALSIEEATECLFDYRGRTPPKTSCGARLITAKVIKDGRILDEPAEFIAAEFYDEWMRRGLPRKNDVLITTEAPLGEVAILRDAEKVALAQRVILLRARPRVVDPHYLFYALQSEFARGELAARASGTTVLGIRQSELRQVRIPYRPLPVQRRIAGILSAYDDLIENNLRRIRIQEEMARALYREWFVDFHFPVHASVSRVDSPLGQIPQGWDGTMGDSATIARMNVMPADFPDEEFDHFSIPAFDETQLPAIETGATILSGKYVVDSSCTLLSKLNPRIPRVWLPYPSGVRRAIASTEFIVLRPVRPISREFLFLHCCSTDFVGRFASHALGTSTSHQRVKPDDLLSMPTIIPSEEVMREFTRTVSPMLDFAHGLRTQNLALRRTRDLLLPRLLSGQLAPATASWKRLSDRRV